MQNLSSPASVAEQTLVQRNLVKTNAKLPHWSALCYSVPMVWKGLWILMSVRDVNATILARIIPVLTKHNALLTFIAIHKQARQNTEEYADQVSCHSLTSVVGFTCFLL